MRKIIKEVVNESFTLSLMMISDDKFISFLGVSKNTSEDFTFAFKSDDLDDIESVKVLGNVMAITSKSMDIESCEIMYEKFRKLSKEVVNGKH